jgi:8-oxo-dGTP pyrophosphatase MutT (NUDIX family)
VLAALYADPLGPHLVLTKRTDAVPTHKGQVSLPGGGYRHEDGDLQVTALREAEEEIGLRPGDVRVLGRLDDAVTVVSGYVVRPFVALVPREYGFAPDPFEIGEIIRMPLATLLEHPFREETWTRGGQEVRVLVQEYDGHRVWGLTARILQQLVQRVVQPLLADVRRSPDGWRGP